MQATAEFSTGDHIAVADIREIKLLLNSGKSDSTLSLTARRQQQNAAEFECF